MFLPSWGGLGGDEKKKRKRKKKGGGVQLTCFLRCGRNKRTRRIKEGRKDGEDGGGVEGHESHCNRSAPAVIDRNKSTRGEAGPVGELLGFKPREDRTTYMGNPEGGKRRVEKRHLAHIHIIELLI